MDDFDFGGFSSAFNVGNLFWTRGADFGVGPSGAWMTDVAFVSDGGWSDMPVVADVGVEDASVAAVLAAVETFAVADVVGAAFEPQAFVSVAAETPLFTAFDWPEQSRFGFGDDDAFVAPIRFAGRTFFSWL